MKTRKEYEKAAKARLEALETDIKQLRKKAGNAKAEFISGHKEQLDKLHELNVKAREKFDELLDASEEVYEEAQEGLEQYWKALGNEIKSYEGFNDRKKK